MFMNMLLCMRRVAIDGNLRVFKCLKDDYNPSCGRKAGYFLSSVNFTIRMIIIIKYTVSIQ